jgi:tetratricopeptide (TPR) repeat protein
MKIKEKLILYCLLVMVLTKFPGLIMNLGNICSTKIIINNPLPSQRFQCIKNLKNAIDIGILNGNRQLGLMQYLSGNTQGAISSWKTVLEEYPHDQFANFYLGIALLPDDRNLAIKYFENANAAWYFLISGNEDLDYDLVDLVKMAILIGDEKKEAELLLYAGAMIVDTDPKYAIELLERALLHTNGDFQLGRGLKLPNVYLSLGVAYFNLLQWDQSITILNDGIQYYQKSGDLYYWLARAHWEKSGESSVDDVIEYLEESIDLNPQFKEKKSLSALGDIYRSIGRLDQSIYYYEELTRIAPNYGYFIDLAKSYNEAGYSTKALNTLLFVIENWPEKQRTYFLLADVYLSQGKTDLACEKLNIAKNMLNSGVTSYQYQSELNRNLIEACDN